MLNTGVLMSNDGRCGAETTADQPCRNPAGDNGRCWIPSHNDRAAENPGGRPTKFTDERAQRAVEAARKGLSKSGCARAAGVEPQTILNWEDDILTFETADGDQAEFFDAFRRARSEGESRLVDGGLYDDETDSSMAKFLLASSFDYRKTEKREHTGEGGGPVQIEVNETVVKTGWEE